MPVESYWSLYKSRLIAIAPAESLGTDAQMRFTNTRGNVRSSAGCCYSADIVERRTPAVPSTKYQVTYISYQVPDNTITIEEHSKNMALDP